MKPASTWVLLALAGSVAIAGYGVAFHRTAASARRAQMATHCPETRSLDDSRALSLSADGQAILRDGLRTDAERVLGGRWNYDDATKTYEITFNRTTTVYRLIEEDDIPGCMLVRGTIEHADLSASWFATIGDRPDGAPPQSDISAR